MSLRAGMILDELVLGTIFAAGYLIRTSSTTRTCFPVRNGPKRSVSHALDGPFSIDWGSFVVLLVQSWHGLHDANFILTAASRFRNQKCVRIRRFKLLSPE